MNIDPDAVYGWLTTYSIKIVGALLIFIIGKWLARHITNLIKKVMVARNVDTTLVDFLKSLIYYALLVVVVIAAVGQLGVNTASFLTVVGAAGLAIGLAMKDSLSNFAAGVMLIFFKPFRKGDFVNAGGVTGKVEKITMFNTEFCTPDNQQIFVPNSAILGKVITNVNAKATRRIDIVSGISYDDDIDKAKAILKELLAADERILKDPAPQIAVAELADSSVNLVVRPWVKTQDYWAVRFDLIENMKKQFDEADITIPYPQRDLHMYNE